MSVLDLDLDGTSTTVRIDHAVIAGWTGRDAVAVERHIRELEALGVAPPAAVPVFYPVSPARLTTDARISCLGTQSSGEAECVLLAAQGRLWVGVGSDHTDRKVETYDVHVSKQMCDKPIAPRFWPHAAVAAHWDRLILRSFAVTGATRTLYQEGTVAAMLAPHDLLARFTASAALPDATLMFGGTLPVEGGIRSAGRFEFELEDPVRGCKIAHGYDILALGAV